MGATKPRSWLEVRLAVPADAVDAVCNFIIENITSGLVLEEEEDSDQSGITFYVSSEKAAAYRKPFDRYLNALVGESLAAVPQISERVIDDGDWQEKYRSSVRPVRIDNDVIVRAGWHEKPEGVVYDIVVEPKMAFGTGSHETTQSCLRAILRHFKTGMRMLDFGAGSGVLAILGDKMGASYIKAIDYDIAAIENCRENFDINQVSTSHDILFGSLEKCEDDEPYDFVCVNIIKSTILSFLAQLDGLTAARGFLILSGLLLQDREEVNQRLEALHLSNYEIDQFNDWLTYVIRKG
jgi:ribosomal protein L11 methyltransferase